MSDIKERLRRAGERATKDLAAQETLPVDVLGSISRRRRATAAVGVLGLTIVVAAVALVTTVGPSSVRSDRTNVASETAGQRSFGRYHPVADRIDGNSVIPIVFPDGTSGELVSPANAGLPEVGVYASVKAWLKDEVTDCSTIIQMSYDNEEVFHPPGDPLATYEMSSGRAELWRAYPDDPYGGRYLIFTIERWKVAIADRASGECVGDANRAQAWADNISLETKDGYVVLRSRPLLKLSRPQLIFADEELLLSVFLLEEQCQLEGPDATQKGDTFVRRSDDFAHWCSRDVAVEFLAESAEEPLLSALVDGVRVQELVQP